MNQVGGWSTYTGSATLILAAVLLVPAVLFALAGARLRTPVKPKQPGRFITVILALVWILAWLSFLISAITYGTTLIAQIGHYTAPQDPISPITFGSAVITFGVVALLSWQRGGITALWSAFVATIAAPMIFELPFDLVVMSRTYPPTPAVQYTLLFFFPLFIVSLSAYALTTTSPQMKLSRYPLFCLAGMFLVFAVWALFGFAYPAEPVPTACNAISKVLSFATAITLFLPLEMPAGSEDVSRETPEPV